MVREGLSEETVYELKSKRSKDTSHSKSRVYRVSGRGNSECKGPEAGVNLELCRNQKEAHVVVPGL